MPFWRRLIPWTCQDHRDDDLGQFLAWPRRVWASRRMDPNQEGAVALQVTARVDALGPAAIDDGLADARDKTRDRRRSHRRGHRGADGGDRAARLRAMVPGGGRGGRLPL
jgi:hypothetical protein